MTAKLDLLAAAPSLMKEWLTMSRTIAASLDHTLAELVKIRASQINGCANCLNMHTAEARARGETEQRIYLLPAWREAPCYSERERAALAWTEALTCFREGHTHAAAYDALAAQFTEEEQVKLTLMINVINGWNRLAVGFGTWLEPADARSAAAGTASSRASGRGGGLRSAAAAADPLAYRMLGSVADAEDVVQEAFMRWMGADRGAVREPEAFLRRTVTRLCLDQLKSARRRREIYVGPWLPEPVVEEEEEAEDVTLPLMLALERLSPLERAAFLLHDVFGVGFDEIAATIGRSPAACRQLAGRARAHVRAARPRFGVEKERGLEIAEAFFAASRERRHGGARRDARRRRQPAMRTAAASGRRRRGRSSASRMCMQAARGAGGASSASSGSTLVRTGFINGLPGFVTREADGELQTTALEIEDGKVAAIYVMRNPDKLRHLHEGGDVSRSSPGLSAPRASPRRRRRPRP